MIEEALHKIEAVAMDNEKAHAANISIKKLLEYQKMFANQVTDLIHIYIVGGYLQSNFPKLTYSCGIVYNRAFKLWNQIEDSLRKAVYGWLG